MDSYGEYGITATQYHAGLDKLWKALAISCAQDRDVFTLCSERIAYLESEVERLKLEYAELLGAHDRMALDEIPALKAKLGRHAVDCRNLIAVGYDKIESDGTPGWFQATACWPGPDDGHGYIGRSVRVVVVLADDEEGEHG